jgi:hypothetical protein
MPPGNAFTLPIRICFGVSRRLGLAFAVVHAGAVGITLSMGVAWWSTVALLIGVVLSAVWCYRWHFVHRGDAITEVLSLPDGRWLITTARPTLSPAVLLPNSLVLPWLTVLVFRLEDGRRRAVLLLPDNVEENAFRRLRVRLRYPVANSKDDPLPPV